MDVSTYFLTPPPRLLEMNWAESRLSFVRIIGEVIGSSSNRQSGSCNLGTLDDAASGSQVTLWFPLPLVPSEDLAEILRSRAQKRVTNDGFR